MTSTINRIVVLALMSLSAMHLMAQSMEWLCRPGKYSDIQYMGFDLFKVRDDAGKWGIVSAQGKEVISAEYDSITHFVEGRALVLDRSGNKIIGILDSDGAMIKSFENDEIFATSYPYYKEGLLSYKRKDGLCGYMNTMGDVSIRPRFYLAAPFHDGIATVQYADSDGYYGLINKSGGSAIISDTKYRFLSSLVDGQLFAVTSSSRGGDLLRVMRLDVNRLKATRTLEKKMFVDLSDDFTYLVSQNGHHYFIDSQWRITGANYSFQLPYQIADDHTFITESAELLSKQETKNGVQITYMGKPILEHSFDKVETYEKKYAIVSAKDKSIGILKLNPSAGIEVFEPTQVFVFNHNPLPSVLTANLDEIEPEQYIELAVDIKDVNPKQLKCYINEDGYLRYAPLKRQLNGDWKIHLPYFRPDTQFDNVISNDIDIAITYDGLEWMHCKVRLATKHEPGYEINISGNIATSAAGLNEIEITVRSINGNPTRRTRIDVTGQKTAYMDGSIAVISIPVNVPEGKSRTFTYTVAVAEEGCPIIKKVVSKTITMPKRHKEKAKGDDKENKEVIII